MASNTTNRTVAGHVWHDLFPSRRSALFALALEVAALLVHLPVGVHAVVAIADHGLIALANRHS